MKIEWCKSEIRTGYRLNLINLCSEYFDSLIGVYVIWYGGNTSNVVVVGQGTIRDKLIDMQIDKKVQEYGPNLFVTWAVVPRASLKGIEAFLSSELTPLVQSNITRSEQISVNLP